MKKLIVFMCVAAMAVSSFAQFKAGMKLRVRAEMENLSEGGNADGYVMNRYVDYRFRPWMSYKINDKLSAKAAFEIGDEAFGNNNGTDLGTDGKGIIEVKHVYMDITPNKNHSIRLGLQAYYDPQSLILDDDYAGISYKGTFDKFSIGASWFVTDDAGEINIDKSTYSFGTTGLTFDANVAINKKMNAGLTFVGKFDNTNVDTLVNMGTTKMWIAPHFEGDFGMVSADLEFVYNMSSVAYDVVSGDTPAMYKDDPDSESGMLLSLKTKIKANDKLNIGVNFLFAPAADKKDEVLTGNFYKGWSTYYMNGTQTLAWGINDATCKVFFARKEGLMMPAVTVDYAVNKTVTIGGDFGMAMTLEDVEYGDNKKDTNLGMEFGVNSKMTIFDNLEFKPYAAFFMPGAAYTKSDDTDMQMKVGTYMRVSF